MSCVDLARRQSAVSSVTAEVRDWSSASVWPAVSPGLQSVGDNAADSRHGGAGTEESWEQLRKQQILFHNETETILSSPSQLLRISVISQIVRKFREQSESWDVITIFRPISVPGKTKWTENSLPQPAISLPEKCMIQDWTSPGC